MMKVRQVEADDELRKVRQTLNDFMSVCKSRMASPGGQKHNLTPNPSPRPAGNYDLPPPNTDRGDNAGRPMQQPPKRGLPRRQQKAGKRYGKGKKALRRMWRRVAECRPDLPTAHHVTPSTTAMPRRGRAPIQHPLAGEPHASRGRRHLAQRQMRILWPRSGELRTPPAYPTPSRTRHRQQ